MVSGLVIALLMAMVARFILISSIRAAYLKKAMNEADSANKAKSLFLSNISHEIRTPLNGILATTELLGKTTLDGKQKRYLDIVHNSGELLFNLLNDVLDISKIEMHKLELHIGPFNLHETISLAMDLFISAARKKGIEMDTFISSDLPLWVYGDRHRLTQILTNLIGNAVKYTEKGHISISASKTELGEIYIEVSDTGIGIPSESLDKIFDRFSQAHAMPTITGTGLGLAICKSLVEMMGGEVGVRSVEREGSTFWLKVPLREASAEHGSIAAEAGDDTSKHAMQYNYKILLAEDVEANREIISDMFSYLGCHTDMAENGAVALDLSLRNRYDLIFMDCNMPVMDGYEASRRLRETHGQEIPIIAISAHAFTEDIKKCYDVGMNDYVSKPVKIDDLEKALQKHGPRKGENKMHKEENQIPPVNENAIIDLSPLREWVGSDTQRLSKIVSMTLQNSRDLYNKMIEGYNHDDRDSLRDSAHALKSIAAQVGGTSLSDLCKDIEIKAQSLSREELSQRIGALRVITKEFFEALEKL